MLFAQTTFVILLPGLSHIRRQPPYWLFAYAVIAYTCLSMIEYLSTAGLWQSGALPDRVYHDTYYVAAHFHYIVSVAIVLVTLFALHFAQYLFVDVPLPQLLVGIFWALHLAIVVTLFANKWLFALWTPKELSERPQIFVWLNGLLGLSGLISFLCLAGMVFLLILSVWRRLTA